MKLRDAYNYGVYFLASNGVDEAEFKSLCLVCDLDGINNGEYNFHKDDEIVMKRFADMLWRLKSGEPLQYVLGKWDFYDSVFKVGQGVLIPRPETEELTELVIKSARKIENPVVLDLCAGSGCIGISVAKAVPSAEVYCVEKSDEAMSYLSENCRMAKNVFPVKGDVFEPSGLPKADIIVSNPPYIKSSELPLLQREVLAEPKEALDGGDDGLVFYRSICERFRRYLKNGGEIFFEAGNSQCGDVKNILLDNGFKNVRIIKDIYGNERMLRAVYQF